ncbi:DUF308 domain-containing protein [Bifidobacterium sp. ESL0745]|uniref:DUF308 domain-containing protein n=1 Tax=Bifidobacterium sp. ESL0745 TaxID=2983226 RepID=UPI0023F9899F|nr:DUF308 domain-containing protein [Bifidobacterium sp. ESL0745]MDF7664791.1 DUF308 domain-containing protein [Bifidobacterium sp. ESL0745]
MTSLKDSNNSDDKRDDADSGAVPADGHDSGASEKADRTGDHQQNTEHKSLGTSDTESGKNAMDTDGKSSKNANDTLKDDDVDDMWKQFEAEHAEDLDDISNSRNAKRFEKHAKREEKKALLSVDDITPDSFAGGFSSSSSKQHGPRDFEGSSWLDADNVMDGFDDFTPPNPDLGHLDPVKVVFWALLIIGIAGLIAAVFFPRFAAIMGLVFGLCALIGGVGLLGMHRGHAPTQTDYYDDGSRV